MGKTNPLNDQDLEDFIQLQKNFKDSALSWSIDISNIDHGTRDLSVKNPNKNVGVLHQSPEKIIREIEELDLQNRSIINQIKELL